MPGDSEHPVTLGDLRVAFEDGWQLNAISHRPATVADLVSALRAEWFPKVWYCRDAFGYERILEEPCGGADSVEGCGWKLLLPLDALAEAQPFPPAGGVS